MLAATPRSPPPVANLKARASSDAASPAWHSLRHLAETLFADHARNRMLMPAWLAEPLAAVVDERRRLTQSATTFEEASRERERQRIVARRRALSVRDGGVGAATARQEQRLHRALVTAAAPSQGRRVVRQTAHIQSIVQAMALSSKRRRAENADDASLVEQLAAFFVVMVSEPLRVTLASDTNGGRLTIYPFGRGRLTRLNVSSRHMSVEELHSITALATMAPLWADAAAYEREGGGGSNSTRGEQLVATRDACDVFEHHFDREHLTRSFVDFLLYGSGRHVVVRHVLSAALVCAASTDRVRRMDSTAFLMRLADAVQVAPVPREPMTEERYRLLAAYANEQAIATRTRTVDASLYLEQMQLQRQARA